MIIMIACFCGSLTRELLSVSFRIYDKFGLGCVPTTKDDDQNGAAKYAIIMFLV